MQFAFLGAHSVVFVSPTIFPSIFLAGVFFKGEFGCRNRDFAFFGCAPAAWYFFKLINSEIWGGINHQSGLNVVPY